MSRRIAVRGIIVHNKKLLCFKLKGYGGRDATEYWVVPGGEVDKGESILRALEREMIEETGIKPNVGNLLFVQQFKKNDSQYNEEIEFFFHIINPEEYLRIDLSKTTHGLDEVDKFDFIDPSKNYVLPKFLTTEPLKIDPKQSVKIFNYL